MTVNGRDAVNPELTEEPQRPPWANVDPRAVVVRLTDQVGGLMQQLAMRDAYIDQLHQALQVAAGLPAEETQPDPVPGVG